MIGKRLLPLPYFLPIIILLYDMFLSKIIKTKIYNENRSVGVIMRAIKKTSHTEVFQAHTVLLDKPVD